jgi:hypothetical protein
MNIEKSYAEKMLTILDKWIKKGYGSNTLGHSITEDGKAYRSTAGYNFGFGGCGGFMSTVYAHGTGARNYWPVGRLGESLTEAEFEELAKLWIQMMGEIYIPIRYIGIKDSKEAKAMMFTACSEGLRSYADKGQLYSRMLITEHDKDNYAHASHFKMAHTAMRYLFRSEMMHAAYHTMKMKLQNPAISVLDCLVTASYHSNNYNSSMMLFRWANDNIKKTWPRSGDAIINYCDFPLPRLRGRIMRQILKQDGKGDRESNTRITSFFTEVIRLKPEDKDYKYLIGLRNNKTVTSERDYLKTLKVLRRLALRKKELNSAIVA